MTYMGPTGPIQPGTPQWHQAGQTDAARGAHVFNQSGHGAIAYSPTARSVATAWGYSSRAEAQATVCEGMPVDADVYWGHHSYVALAQGSSGLYAFAHGTSAFRAMQAALKAAGDPDAHVTKLINTNSGELDPQQQWEQGLRYAQMRRVVGKGIKWYLMACLIVVFVIAVAAIGAHAPVLAFIMIGLAIAFAVWRYRRRR
jgi:Domain of unknown function (DUF4189)